MIKTLKKFSYILSKNERKHASILIGMMFLMALLDVMGVASIIPFVSVISNPSLIETNTFINKLYLFSNFFGVENQKEFLFALGILVFFILVFSLSFKAFTNYLQLMFVNMREYSIGKRLVEGYLHQPYIWFLNRHSADLAKSIHSEVNNVISGGITPLMNLISHTIVFLALFVLLIVVDPKLAVTVFVTIGFCYGIIYKINRNFLNRIGAERLKANQLRFTSISEAFGAIKEVKMGGFENFYLKQFSTPSKIFAKRQAESQILGLLPRYAIEIIAFGGMLILIIYLLGVKSSFTNVLPIIALYAFAGYRLMPSIQIIYASLVQLRFIGPAVSDLYNELKNLKKPLLLEIDHTLTFSKCISLNNISFNYPGKKNKTLKDINLEIFSGSVVGFVGTTGSGKTTTVDIISGLIEAQKGTLKVDNKIITDKNLRAWQNLIGYVPQNIYLSNNTVKANIAFAVDPEKIDQHSVEKASKIANLHNFVNHKLPNKYETFIGERGIKISGGEKQRIGIARALYFRPKLLIFDEATSSLDNLTERLIMDEIYSIKKEATIILIAHRLTTIKKCDQIFFFKNGQIIDTGTYEELIEKNIDFKVMAEGLNKGS